MRCSTTRRKEARDDGRRRPKRRGRCGTLEQLNPEASIHGHDPIAPARLRRRRRRLCRLRARVAPERGPGRARLPDRGRRPRPQRADPVPGRARPARRAEHGELGLRDRAAGGPERAPRLPCRAARCSAARARSTRWSTRAASPRTTTHWAAAGDPGWGWGDVLPYFLRAEHNERGAEATSTAPAARSTSPTCAARTASPPLRRGRGAGGPAARNADFNGARAGGRRPLPGDAKGGERCNAAKAYLTPALGRPEPGGADATRTRCASLFEGRRAIGVEMRARRRPARRVRAAREVVLSAGALQSPQLLHAARASGPARTCSAHGMAVRARRARRGRATCRTTSTYSRRPPRLERAVRRVARAACCARWPRALECAAPAHAAC